jgi:CRP-like cAMP-binding protein
MTLPDPRRVRLLDVDPDLGADLDADSLEQAERFMRLPLVELPSGAWEPAMLQDHPAVQGPVIGCLVVSGLITRDIQLGDRVCTHLYGPRDFVSLNALDLASLPFAVAFGALSDAQVVLLDDRFLAAGQRWPRVMGRMFDTATSQLGRQSADQAIAQLPRVEDRLLALFWHLADRWGTRHRDDIAIGLPLTHEALGRLIGARRPTVSLGLRALADEGALRREGDLWILSASSIDALSVGGPPRQRARPAPAAAGGVTPPVLVVVPDPPVAEDGNGENGRQHLRERVAALREQLEADHARVRQTITANREIRERVTQARASRAAGGDRDGAATAPA